ncbi:hypothetical protein I6F15_27225 [Bradyrhizobium sp. BRP14]|nr:hypothetical protein [Bradyrhizobium sp. BRP14]
MNYHGSVTIHAISAGTLDVDAIISLKPRVLVFGPESEIFDRITLDTAVNSETAKNDYGFSVSLTAYESSPGKMSGGGLH